MHLENVNTMKWKIIIIACVVLFGYNIFKGKASDLIPDRGFMPYELSTTLFSDYAEKQRLIKLPAGSSLKAANNALPEFPEVTSIGFKIQNLNIDVLRQGAIINQLTCFHNSSIMDAVKGQDS